MKKASHSNLIHFSTFSKRAAAEVLVLPFWKRQEGPQAAFTFAADQPQLLAVLSSGDFKGKEGEVIQVYVDSSTERRIILLGIGECEKLNAERLRRIYGSLSKHCLKRHLKDLNVVVPEQNQVPDEVAAKAIVDGLLLPNYDLGKYKKSTSETGEFRRLETVHLIGLDAPGAKEAAHEAKKLIDCVNFARDHVNANADEITPDYLADSARALAKQYPQLKTTVFDKKRIQKEGMGLLLAVNRGSNIDPAFIIIEYKGNPKSSDHTVIVGKGITYDTGGLNIKTAHMELMKCDMAGAAACLGIMKAIGEVKPKINVTALIPATENSVDAASFKPGDVYVGYAGKSVEMMNSDAEGRLILADALAYAVDQLSPTRIIDLATLTGAMEISLGSEATGLMCTDDDLAEQLIEVGDECGERLWRLPLFDEYREILKSDIADIKSWNGRSASSCVAATFLKDFVGEVPYAHLDIASTAYLTEPKRYLPKMATGVGIRLLMEFFKRIT